MGEGDTLAQSSPGRSASDTREQLHSQLRSVEVLLNVTEQHFRRSKIAIDRVREEYRSLEHAIATDSEPTEVEALEPRFKILRARLELLSRSADASLQ